MSNKVLPGYFISNCEEFLPGRNTFEYNDKIYSDSIGIKEEDMSNRVANVRKLTRELEPLDLDCVVLGIIEKNKDFFSLVRLFKAYKDSKEVVITNSYAFLPIHNMANFYIKDIRDLFRIGDLVKARVVEITNFSVTLTTKDVSLGVVKAFCTNCRHTLSREGVYLRCKNCNSLERRKISSDYLKI
ncbi:MAG: exosome complex RNA-binding protein Csl4 [Candidatus Diapherotrites archaeon]|nr:exosome complex RNA-binding protein Csl4 [Candidatus Diapherotrites archaeon]